MRDLLRSVEETFIRLVEAIPFAWQRDKIFRWAVLAAGVFLLLLLTREGPGLHLVPGPVPTLTGTAGMPAAAPAVPVAPTPTIAPGQPLGPAPSPPPGHSTGADNGDDSFGTVPSGKHP